jgi:hypothetical protein
MKVDKQQLKKHHFWILLGVFALLAVVLIILVPIGIGGMIAAKEAKIKQTEDSLKGQSNPKTEDEIAKLQSQKDRLAHQREVIWRKAWLEQRDFLQWPEVKGLRDRLSHKYFGDEIERNDRDTFIKDDVYLSEYEQIAAAVRPTELVGGVRAILQPVTWDISFFPSSEELWLALEDYCVRREILNIVSEANMMTARFKEVPFGKEEKIESKPGEFTKRFESRLWRIDLTLSRSNRDYVFRGKLTNVSGKRQVVGQMDLKVIVEKERATPVTLPILVEAVSAGETVTLKETKVAINVAPEGLFGVQQVLTTRTVPVKKVLVLQLGTNAGHRMANLSMKPHKMSGPPPEAANTGAGNSGGGMGGNAGGIPMMPPGTEGSSKDGMGMSGQGRESGNLTPNHIPRNRYIDVTDQVRRMPVAILLRVDPNHIQDVLVAFSNSKLRFQNTQLHWQRFQGQADSGGGMGGGSMGPAGPAGPGGPGMAGGRGSDDGAPMGPGAGPGMGPGPKGGPGSGAPAGPSGPGMGSGFGSGSTISNDQTGESLIDLSLYGIASIYEKPRDQAPPATTAGGVPAAGGAPAPGAPAAPPAPTAGGSPEPKGPASENKAPPAPAGDNKGPATPPAADNKNGAAPEPKGPSAPKN